MLLLSLFLLEQQDALDLADVLNRPAQLVLDGLRGGLLLRKLLFFLVVLRHELSVKAENVSQERLPIRMRSREFAQMKHVAEIVLGAQQVSQALTESPRFECAPVQQSIQQITRPIEGHFLVIPLRQRQPRQVLVPGLMALEADLGGFFDAAPDRHERSIFQLDLQEEDEVLEQFDVFEKKELGIALGKEAKVEQTPKRGLAEVMGVLVSVLRQANFSHYDVQALDELHRLEQVRLAGIKSRQLHLAPCTPRRRSWGDIRSGP